MPCTDAPETDSRLRSKGADSLELFLGVSLVPGLVPTLAWLLAVREVPSLETLMSDCDIPHLGETLLIPDICVPNVEKSTVSMFRNLTLSREFGRELFLVREFIFGCEFVAVACISCPLLLAFSYLRKNVFRGRVQINSMRITVLRALEYSPDQRSAHLPCTCRTSRSRSRARSTFGRRLCGSVASPKAVKGTGCAPAEGQFRDDFCKRKTRLAARS